MTQEMQQSSDMVERLVVAFDEIAPAWTSVADLEGYAKAALEACHHAELVEALQEAERCLSAILVDYGVDRHRARAEAATNVFRVLLAKIGSDNAPHHERVSGSPSPGKARFENGGDA